MGLLTRWQTRTFESCSYEAPNRPIPSALHGARDPKQPAPGQTSNQRVKGQCLSKVAIQQLAFFGWQI